MLRRKSRRIEIPTTERRSHRPDRTGHDDDLMQRRRDVLLRSAARQLDW
jgi:hypothetical protein